MIVTSADVIKRQLTNTALSHNRASLAFHFQIPFALHFTVIVGLLLLVVLGSGLQIRAQSLLWFIDSRLLTSQFATRLPHMRAFDTYYHIRSHVSNISIVECSSKCCIYLPQNAAVKMLHTFQHLQFCFIFVSYVLPNASESVVALLPNTKTIMYINRYFQTIIPKYANVSAFFHWYIWPLPY